MQMRGHFEPRGALPRLLRGRYLPADWLKRVRVSVCIYHEQPDPLQLLFLRVVLSVNQLVSLLDDTNTNVTL